MKLNLLYAFFALALGFTLLQSSSQGRANAADSGNTGAPGDATATCITCHGNNPSVDVSLAIEASDGAGNVITEFIPDSTYNMKVTITTNMGSPEGFGFQITALNAELDQPGDGVPDWSDPSDNVRIVTVNASGRTYAEHKGPSSTNEFTAKWKAPETGSGVVTFYACGNGINGNGSNSGDAAACNTLVLNEATIVNTNDLEENLSIAIGPNPASHFVNITSTLQEADNYNIQFFTINGQLVQTHNQYLPAGQQNTTIDISDLQKGIYLIRVDNGQQAVNTKLFKL